MECDEEHVLGKVVLVQASEHEEDILHLHWYKRVHKWTLHYSPLTVRYGTYHTEHEFTWLPVPYRTPSSHMFRAFEAYGTVQHSDGPIDNGFPAVNI